MTQLENATSRTLKDLRPPQIMGKPVVELGHEGLPVGRELRQQNQQVEFVDGPIHQ
jgi:hypothetical protein